MDFTVFHRFRGPPHEQDDVFCATKGAALAHNITTIVSNLSRKITGWKRYVNFQSQLWSGCDSVADMLEVVQSMRDIHAPPHQPPPPLKESLPAEVLSRIKDIEVKSHVEFLLQHVRFE